VRLVGPGGERIESSQCPVAFWARVGPRGSIIPDSTAVRNATLLWIEQAEYNAETDEYIPTPRNTSSVLDLVRVEDG
jgi:hypothetical protein